MPRRKASINCRSAGAIGFLNLWIREGGRVRQHEANRAKVRIITDRYSGLEVEFVEHHKTYQRGERIVVGRDDFVSDIQQLQDFVTEEKSQTEKRAESRKGKKQPQTV